MPCGQGLYDPRRPLVTIAGPGSPEDSAYEKEGGLMVESSLGSPYVHFDGLSGRVPGEHWPGHDLDKDIVPFVWMVVFISAIVILCELGCLERPAIFLQPRAVMRSVSTG